MLKSYCILLLVLTQAFYAQSIRIKIVDAENLSPIYNARILMGNQVFYTNDDGIALIPSEWTEFEIFASDYKKEKIEKFRPEVKLQPLYESISEVKIVKVDIKKIFEAVIKNYDKAYYSKPSLYDITYKQKNFYGGELSFLVIADGKLWTGTNQYNFKYGFKKKYDDILQMQLNTIKYLKTTDNNDRFLDKTNEFSHEIIGNYFFNYELSRLVGILKLQENKGFGNITFVDGDFEHINFKIKNSNGSVISGKFVYDTFHKAISKYEVSYDQSASPPLKKKSVDGKDFDYQLGVASLDFDFYIKDDKYFPSQYNFDGDNFIIILDGQKHIKKFSRQITYNVFNVSNSIGLDPKIDFTKDFIDNVPNNEIKSTTVLLSDEEKKFLKISTNEK